MWFLRDVSQSGSRWDKAQVACTKLKSPPCCNVWGSRATDAAGRVFSPKQDSSSRAATIRVRRHHSLQPSRLTKNGIDRHSSLQLIFCNIKLRCAFFGTKPKRKSTVGFITFRVCSDYLVYWLFSVIYWMLTKKIVNQCSIELMKLNLVIQVNLLINYLYN